MEAKGVVSILRRYVNRLRLWILTVDNEIELDDKAIS